MPVRPSFPIFVVDLLRGGLPLRLPSATARISKACVAALIVEIIKYRGPGTTSVFLGV